MVEQVRSGVPQRAVARRFRVALLTVQRWVARAGEMPLDAVDWTDRPSARREVNRTPAELEDRIVAVRRELRLWSPLGEHGPAAIARELAAQGLADIPSERTIARVCERRGVVDRRRIRRPSPPPGWYLPDVRDREAELDAFDVIEDIALVGGIRADILTGISLHGAEGSAWPRDGIHGAFVAGCLAQRWGELGAAPYAQFDNDTRFAGSHGRENAIGIVVRFCLALGVTPVFAPPHEMGVQAAIEAFNGRWQRGVRRVFVADLAHLGERSAAYVAADRARRVARVEAAPPRRPLPAPLRVDLGVAVRGRMVFIRRTRDDGSAVVLGRRYPVDPAWPNRLVRADLDIDARRLRVFRLRRREPFEQPLLADIPFEYPPFWNRRLGGAVIQIGHDPRK
jgi:putative transposase